MALLCACEDGKRCGECCLIEFYDSARQTLGEQVDAWVAEADQQWLKWLASPPAPAEPTSPEPQSEEVP